MWELILTFHGIGKPPREPSPAESHYWWDENAFCFILDQLTTVELPGSREIRITFDDGHASDVEIALPELLSRNLKATFFICAGRVGIPGYLDAKGINRLLEAGMEVGSHGMNHVDWRQASDDDLSVEISHARKILEAVSGRPVTKASIPFGSYDHRVLERLRSEGLKSVYSSDGGLANSRNWLKPRNTLDRGFSSTSIYDLNRKCSTFGARLRQWGATHYKLLR